MHDAAMAVLVLANTLHAQGGLAAVNDVVIGEGGDPFVVLKTPPTEVVAGHVLNVGVDELGWVILLERGEAAFAHERACAWEDRQALLVGCSSGSHRTWPVCCREECPR